ncbi:hypothetical protein AB1M95_00905 [Sulfitobacter sp. LCG007]
MIHDAGHVDKFGMRSLRAGNKTENLQRFRAEPEVQVKPGQIESWIHVYTVARVHEGGARRSDLEIERICRGPGVDGDLFGVGAHSSRGGVFVAFVTGGIFLTVADPDVIVRSGRLRTGDAVLGCRRRGGAF